jgi:hypothetical protein
MTMPPNHALQRPSRSGCNRGAPWAGSLGSLPLQHTMSNVTYLLQRSYASSCLDVMKMKAFVPCDVADELNKYKANISEVVFDPLKVQETNAQYTKAGYIIPDDFAVIALTTDKKILLWGGLNSVYYLRKGEKLHKSLEKNLAFNDIVDLTNHFKIKNKKPELDALLAQLHELHGKK